MAKRGRPELPPEQRRKPRTVRASDADWAVLLEAAEAAGESVSDYLLRAGLDRATAAHRQSPR